MSVALNVKSDLEYPKAHAISGIFFILNQVNFLFLAKLQTLNRILDEVDAPKDINLMSVDSLVVKIEVLFELIS